MEGLNLEEGAGRVDDDLISFMVSRDQAYLVDPNYFESKQPELKKRMRAILLDWILEVADEFRFVRETFHLACTYIDLFLSKRVNLPM